MDLHGKPINLFKHFGHRYQVELNTTDNPGPIDWNNPDPDRMFIPCVRGRIYPALEGGKYLLAEVHRQPRNVTVADLSTVLEPWGERNGHKLYRFRAENYGIVFCWLRAIPLQRPAAASPDGTAREPPPIRAWAIGRVSRLQPAEPKG